MTAKFYEDSFLRAWRAFGGRGSKVKAYNAWQKTASQRPSEDLMLCCIAAYLEDLNAFNKTRKPDQQRDKLHMSTFLSERDMRWETFLDRAEELLRAQQTASAGKDASLSVSASTWPEAVLKALRLSEPVLKAWFHPCVLKLGKPSEVIAPTRMHANWLLSHFPQNLERALGGDYRVTYP